MPCVSGLAVLCVFDVCCAVPWLRVTSAWCALWFIDVWVGERLSYGSCLQSFISLTQHSQDMYTQQSSPSLHLCFTHLCNSANATKCAPALCPMKLMHSGSPWYKDCTLSMAHVNASDVSSTICVARANQSFGSFLHH